MYDNHLSYDSHYILNPKINHYNTTKIKLFENLFLRIKLKPRNVARQYRAAFLCTGDFSGC